MVLTSSNLSVAAWGAMQKKNSQLFIRSFEMGVLYIPEVYRRYLNHRHRDFYLTDLPFNGIQRNLDPSNVSGTGDAEEVEFEMVYQGQEMTREERENKILVQFPIPMKVMDDVRRYESSDRMWIWDLKYDEPDLYGMSWPGAGK